MAQIKSSQGRSRTVRRKRADWLAEIKPLREQGLNGAEIARELGLASSFVYTLLNDPDGSKERARKDGYRKPCPRCGTPMNGSNPGVGRSLVCASCAPDAYRTWTREVVIEAIQEYARQFGTPPAATDWGGGKPSECLKKWSASKHTPNGHTPGLFNNCSAPGPARSRAPGSHVPLLATTAARPMAEQGKPSLTLENGSGEGLSLPLRCW